MILTKILKARNSVKSEFFGWNVFSTAPLGRSSSFFESPSLGLSVTVICENSIIYFKPNSLQTEECETDAVDAKLEECVKELAE